MEGILRIIQSIPSPKAEPFKRWMAQVAAQRLDQMQDPELSIEQAVVTSLNAKEAMRLKEEERKRIEGSEDNK